LTSGCVTHTLHRKVGIDRIPFPRRERKLPMILSRDEVKALLEAPSALRDRAMLAILYGSGLRVSEVTRLKVADIGYVIYARPYLKYFIYKLFTTCIGIGRDLSGRGPTNEIQFETLGN
jgi:integrase